MRSYQFQTPVEGFDVVPSDTVDHTRPAWGIYVGVGGDVAIVTANGTVLVHKNVPAGSTIRLGSVRVNVTGTTATDMVGYIY